MSGEPEDLGLIFERARAELVAAGWTDHGDYFTHPDAERNPFHPHEEVDKWTMLTWSLRQALALKRAADAARADERGRMTAILAEVAAERARQDAKWGEQNHPDLPPHPFADDLACRAAFTGAITAKDAKFRCQKAAEEGNANWAAILAEEVAEAIEAIGDDAALRTELIQVAAVCVQWAQAIDRRQR